MTTNDFEKDAIIAIQKYLRHLSFHDERLGGAGSVPIDGIWDSATRNALIKFQKSRVLPATGTADKMTWDALKKEYDESIIANSPPVPLALFPRYPSAFILKKDDRGFLVSAVQFLLGELERLYGYPPPDHTGVYDEPTIDAVKHFQSKNGIAPTGNADKKTWDALALQHNLLIDYKE